MDSTSQQIGEARSIAQDRFIRETKVITEDGVIVFDSREEISGRYEVVRPDGSAVCTGIKIGNTSPKNNPLIAIPSDQGTTYGKVATATDEPLSTQQASILPISSASVLASAQGTIGNTKGYLHGQRFNGEEKKKRRVDPEIILWLDGFIDGCGGTTRLYLDNVNSPAYLAFVADPTFDAVRPAKSASGTGAFISLAAGSNSMNYSLNRLAPKEYFQQVNMLMWSSKPGYGYYQFNDGSANLFTNYPPLIGQPNVVFTPNVFSLVEQPNGWYFYDFTFGARVVGEAGCGSVLNTTFYSQFKMYFDEANLNA